MQILYFICKVDTFVKAKYTHHNHMKSFINTTLFIICLILISTSCEKNNQFHELDTQEIENIKYWESLAGSLEDYTFQMMVSMRPYADTIICSGLKLGKPWFSIHRESDGKKIAEWEDTEVLDTSLVLTIYKGYGESIDLKYNGVAPCFYKTYNGSSVVELVYRTTTDSFCLDYQDVGINGPDRYDLESGLALYSGFVVMSGYYHYPLQQVIFHNGNTRIARDFTEGGNNYWPTTVYNGYNDSVFIGKDCINLNNEVLYNCKNEFYGLPNPTLDFYTSYSEYISVGILSYSKYDIQNNKKLWSKEITPPFEIPDGANPKTTINRSSLTDEYALYSVTMLFYDGTKHAFSYKISVPDGELSIL